MGSPSDVMRPTMSCKLSDIFLRFKVYVRMLRTHWNCNSDHDLEETVARMPTGKVNRLCDEQNGVKRREAHKSLSPTSMRDGEQFSRRNKQDGGTQQAGRELW